MLHLANHQQKIRDKAQGAPWKAVGGYLLYVSGGSSKSVSSFPTMVSKSPNTWGYSLSKWPFHGLQMGGTKYLLNGMILQVGDN